MSEILTIDLTRFETGSLKSFDLALELHHQRGDGPDVIIDLMNPLEWDGNGITLNFQGEPVEEEETSLYRKDNAMIQVKPKESTTDVTQTIDAIREIVIDFHFNVSVLNLITLLEQQAPTKVLIQLHLDDKGKAVELPPSDDGEIITKCINVNTVQQSSTHDRLFCTLILENVETSICVDHKLTVLRDRLTSRNHGVYKVEYQSDNETDGSGSHVANNLEQCANLISVVEEFNLDGSERYNIEINLWRVQDNEN